MRPLHVAGFAVFVFGSVHQVACHRILRNLRGAIHRTARARVYGIPKGDWFEHVSCAHYLVRCAAAAAQPGKRCYVVTPQAHGSQAEVVLYCGLAAVTGARVIVVRRRMRMLQPWAWEQAPVVRC
jgi:hypothetical protein